MAKVEGVIVCLSILVMDIVAGVLGIEAEIAQNKVNSPLYFHLKVLSSYSFQFNQKM